MNKVKFGKDDSRIVDLQTSARLEKEQAYTATRKATRMQRRIRTFYDAIGYVSFSSAEEAPIWAPNWLDWLLDGTMPVPDVAEETGDAEVATVEDLSEDQPGNEPDAPAPDDQPDPPTATVA